MWWTLGQMRVEQWTLDMTMSKVTSRLSRITKADKWK